MRKVSRMLRTRYGAGLAVLVILCAAVAVAAESAERIFQQAIEADRAGNSEEAIELFTRAAELDPKNGAILSNRAIVYARKKEYATGPRRFESCAETES